ncbi:prefoldin subunit beta [Staphylothermus hellenicus]|uniref:Prefoldin subunit beta n=1 Tax=Staphylothermus hellenicus (strain DSM 12710 / JCM 10830 / BK20S6-10-b1 / P8) TaxID=591019 RepID=D7DA96_STAHD|nr:prefoldin subunit beta [Staphylothermus hellenicus]ADI32692.1 prefoldin, beta subunit [Staphylothermus hellenicus DSM 12710]
MSQQRLPPEVQQTLTQYQTLRDNYAKLDAELKLVEAELADIDHVLDTLKTMEQETDIYKMVGHVLVKKSRDEIIKELEERKEILGIKKDKYKKQLEILEKQISDLEKRLRELLAKYGITVA